MELLEGLATTRAIRRYLPTPIPEHDLASILWHATRAPTGSNRQSYRFVVLRESDEAQRAKALLGHAFRSAWAEKRREGGFDQGSGKDPASPKARTAAAMQSFVDHVEQIPVIVLPCLIRYRAANPYEGASIYPACQNLLIAARALGYGGVLTMWHQSVETELRSLLGIPESAAISATLTLGVPAGRHGKVRRRPVREVVADGHWDAVADWAIEPPDPA